MNKFKTFQILCVAAVVTAGCMYHGAVAQQSTTEQQTDMATTGTNVNPFIGINYACARMTNGSTTNIYSIQPPSNAVSCLFQDVSGFSGFYTSSLVVMRKSDGFPFYTNNNNSLIFPVTNKTTYTFTVFVKSPLPPPTNGQSMVLQTTWNTSTN